MFRLHNAACTFLHIGRLGRVRLAADRRGARRGRLELDVDCQLLRCRDSALAAALAHASFSRSAMVTKSFSKIPELTQCSIGCGVILRDSGCELDLGFILNVLHPETLLLPLPRRKAHVTSPEGKVQEKSALSGSLETENHSRADVGAEAGLATSPRRVTRSASLHVNASPREDNPVLWWRRLELSDHIPVL